MLHVAPWQSSVRRLRLPQNSASSYLGAVIARRTNNVLNLIDAVAPWQSSVRRLRLPQNSASSYLGAVIARRMNNILNLSDVATPWQSFRKFFARIFSGYTVSIKLRSTLLKVSNPRNKTIAMNNALYNKLPAVKLPF